MRWITTKVDDYLATLPDPLRGVAEQLRVIIDAELPAAGGGIVWHGHPVWKIAGSPTCMLKAYSSYVTFGFWQGQSIEDPSGRLESGARTMAHVKLRGVDDVDAELFADWLRQAGERERASSA